MSFSFRFMGHSRKIKTRAFFFFFIIQLFEKVYCEIIVDKKICARGENVWEKKLRDEGNGANMEERDRR